MKTILILTDFDPASLDCIPAICNQYKSEQLNFVLMHMFKMSDSMGELLMLSRRNREYDYISDEFYNRLSHLKSQQKDIDTIKIEFFYGSTLSIFKNYLEANDIDGILNPESCSIKKINKMSIDPVGFINKSNLTIINIQAVEPVESKVVDIPKLKIEEILLEA